MAIPEGGVYTGEDYDNLPDDVRAELIDGYFYNMSPPNRRHQRILGLLFNQIFNHISENNGDCEVYPAPFAVNLFPERDNTYVEPDISVICDKDKLTDRGCAGAPDWIIEIISPGNPEHDYVRKLSLYMEAGVREYWIVNPIKETIFVYSFKAEDSTPEMYTFEQQVPAGIYPGFSINFLEIAKMLS